MQNYYLNQLINNDNWLKKAIINFNNGFKRFDNLNVVKDQVKIGVYGPTQVGKTTFILSLLGLGAEELTEVSDALRGGRPKGKSATITTFSYGRSKDENFKITDLVNDKEIIFHEVSELEDYLKKLREEIEQSYADGEDQVKFYELYIAKRYITNPVLIESSRNLQLLDLPGFDTREKKESNYVSKLLKHQFNTCDVIVLMELANQVVNLQNIHLPEFKRWFENPNRFRVVLTKSVTDLSVYKKIKNRRITNKKDFLAHNKSELTRVINKDFEGVYPLEFGDSWNHLKREDHVIASTVAPWLTDIYQSLSADLSQNKTIEGQVANYRKLEVTLVNQEKEELSKLELEKSELKNEIKKLCERIDYEKKGIKTLQRKVDRLNETIDELEQVYIYDLPTLPEKQIEDESLFSLLKQIIDWSLHAGLSCKTENDWSEELMGKYEIDQVRNALLGAAHYIFKGKIDELSYIVSDTQHFNPDKYEISFEYSNKEVRTENRTLKNIFTSKKKLEKTADREKLSTIIHDFCRFIYIYKNECNQAKEEAVKQLKKKLKEIEAIGYSLQNRIKKREKDKAVLLENYHHLRKRKKLVKEEWLKDKGRLDLFDNLLMEEWLAEFNKLNEGLARGSTGELWLMHQKLNTLLIQGERVIKNG
ncbi:dynamin family protein [Salipaludibacillus sp. CUR1]|uniref:dynamin family protein n=1 Tax=Salipaludibacillus sp. CUR1 TaxID=2820003 RepID=UPI001E296296|nr:dynamin family protein [Salipaludibacillus sp. CUR1]MCE7791517.1 dynamin family protein [Salipaludibacillus sp. CUR1]